MLKAVFFDLDSTLLPMDERAFEKGYFKMLAAKASKYGYDSDKLIKVILEGTKMMICNDGKYTNEHVFWSNFKKVYGEEKIKDKVIFDKFYDNEFKDTKMFCSENPYLKDLMNYLHQTDLKIILATNPLFPKNGVITRMGFVGLEEKDFDYITNYSNSSYAKPNPLYYKEILDKLSLKPDEVIMFGNSLEEDGLASSKLGIKSYILRNDSYQGNYENITFIEFKDIINVIKAQKGV